ncbi:hypothetical protein C8R47DRAFT_812462 [Mycena vitilis]|nr:hypothetical protein C8R47DRAFT_812462 [Mycena vitilis]
MVAPTTFLPLSPSPSPPSAAHHLFATEQDAAAGMHHGQPYPAHPSLLYAASPASSSSMDYGSYSNPLTLLPCDGVEGMGVGQVGVSRKRYRKTFQCAGYGECRMVFSRSEHLARHVRKHTGERPFACHCTRQFSRLDNLRQHAQTVHSAPEDKPLNERMMRALVMAGVRGRRRFGDASPPHLASPPPHLVAPMAFGRDGEVYVHGQGQGQGQGRGQQEQPLPSPPYSASASASGFAWGPPPPSSLPPSSHLPSHPPPSHPQQAQGHPSFPPGAFSASASTSSPASASSSACGSGSASPPFAYDGSGSGSPVPSPSLFGSFADVSVSPYPSPGAFYAQQAQAAPDYFQGQGRVRVKQEQVEMEMGLEMEMGRDLDLDGLYAALEGAAHGHASASSLSSDGSVGVGVERPETAHPPERAAVWQGQQQQQQRAMGQRRLELQQQQRGGGRGARGEYLPSPPQSPSFYGVGATSAYASGSQHPAHTSHPLPSHVHTSQHAGHQQQHGHPSQQQHPGHVHVHAHRSQRQQQQHQAQQDNGGPFGWTLDDATPQGGAGGAGEMSNAQYYAALQAQSSSTPHAQAQAQGYIASPYPSPPAHPMHPGPQQGGQEGYFYGAGGMGGGGGGQGGYAVFA